MLVAGEIKLIDFGKYQNEGHRGVKYQMEENKFTISYRLEMVKFITNELHLNYQRIGAS